MTYFGMPVIIPILASGYLLAIYLLLMLAQRMFKNSRYASNSLTNVYAAYSSTEQASKLDEVESSRPQQIQQASSVR